MSPYSNIQNPRQLTFETMEETTFTHQGFPELEQLYTQHKAALLPEISPEELQALIAAEHPRVEPLGEPMTREPAKKEKDETKKSKVKHFWGLSPNTRKTKNFQNGGYVGYDKTLGQLTPLHLALNKEHKFHEVIAQLFLAGYTDKTFQVGKDKLPVIYMETRDIFKYIASNFPGLMPVDADTPQLTTVLEKFYHFPRNPARKKARGEFFARKAELKKAKEAYSIEPAGNKTGGGLTGSVRKLWAEFRNLMKVVENINSNSIAVAARAFIEQRKLKDSKLSQVAREVMFQDIIELCATQPDHPLLEKLAQVLERHNSGEFDSNKAPVAQVNNQGSSGPPAPPDPPKITA
jgi:hypothetical protein